MCGPVAPIISAALTVAGAAVSAQQQSAYVNAVNAENRRAYEMSRKARQDELARQQVLEQESAGQFEQSLENLSRPNQDARFDADSEAFLAAFDERPLAQEGQLLSGQDVGAPAFQQEAARFAAQGSARARERIAALAKLGAYGGVEVGNNINLQNTNNSLNTINGLRRGSLGVASFEGNVPAAQVYQGSTVLADILSGAGQTVALAGGRARAAGGGGGGVTTRSMGIY